MVEKIILIAIDAIQQPEQTRELLLQPVIKNGAVGGIVQEGGDARQKAFQRAVCLSREPVFLHHTFYILRGSGKIILHGY
jgi:hypothetical protein